MAQDVLIADDDPFFARLAEKYLRRIGYEVVWAPNGKDALKLLLDRHMSIVITDWNMPVMGGGELIRAIRSHEGIGFVYIVVVTTTSDTSRLIEAFEAGADEFLAKPINRHELLARLRAADRILRLEGDLAKRTREIHRLNAEMALAYDKLNAANGQLARMATTDELTGLVNRREALTRLRSHWDERSRYGKELAVIALDIDHFKRINDTRGHAAGDIILKQVSRLLKSNVRNTDIACRMGGEEFLVICPNVGAKGATTCAEHLRAAIEQHSFRTRDADLTVTASFGVAECAPGMTTPDDLLHRADEALYESKRGGRNRTSTAFVCDAKSPAPRPPRRSETPVVQASS